MTMKLRFWPDMNPPGHTPFMPLKLLFGNEPVWNPTLYDVTHGVWQDANGWTNDENQAVLFTHGTWNQIANKMLLSDATGMVTVESIAEHIYNRMDHWWLAGEWIKLYLEALDRSGHHLGLVAMDFEGGVANAGSHDVYNHPTDPYVTMQEVIAFMLQDSKYVKRLPELDYEALLVESPYANKDTKQAFTTWNHWARKWTVRAWDKYINQPVQDMFGEDCICCAYDCSRYRGSPLLDWNSGMPRPSEAVGGHSSPVLYLNDGYKYQDNDDLMAAYDVCNPHRSITPWIGHPSRTDAPWHCSQEQFDELVQRIEAEGHSEWICVF